MSKGIEPPTPWFVAMCSNPLLEILGFATKIQLHTTHAIANLCSCIKQVAHDIRLHVTLRMQHVYTMFKYMFIHTY